MGGHEGETCGQTRVSDGMVFLRDIDKLSEAAGVCIRTWMISY